MKHCSRCKTFKPKDDFYAHPRTIDGLQSQCKACIRVAGTEWRSRNREEHNRRAAARYHAKVAAKKAALTPVLPNPSTVE